MTSSTILHASVRRLVLAATCGVVLLLMYLLVPGAAFAPVVTDLAPRVADSAVHALRLINITIVLAATAAVTVVAMVRKLPYGIGSVLMLCLGANLSCAGIQLWAAGLPEAALPSGHLVAVAALVAATRLVAAPRFVPVVTGLGAALVIAVAGVVALGVPTSLLALGAAGLLVIAWWAAASAVMQYSPIAAERERARPDTAALALSRGRPWNADR